MEAGKLVYQIADAHGPNIELTAIALDKSGYRLATGAYDGKCNEWLSESIIEKSTYQFILVRVQ